MSRTVRRKNAYNKSSFLYSEKDTDENGIINWSWRRNRVGLTLKEANIKESALYHTLKNRGWHVQPDGYNRDYRAKSKNQLRSQLINSDDYESISIDSHCNNWYYW